MAPQILPTQRGESPGGAPRPNGALHSVSKRHPFRYLDEFAFRWNTRYDSDSARVVKAIRQSVGRRLVYQTATTC